MSSRSIFLLVTYVTLLYTSTSTITFININFKRFFMVKENSSSQVFVKFKCPNCLKSEITRTLHEREVGAKYECKQCGFTGPN